MACTFTFSSSAHTSSGTWKLTSKRASSTVVLCRSNWGQARTHQEWLCYDLILLYKVRAACKVFLVGGAFRTDYKFRLKHMEDMDCVFKMTSTVQAEEPSTNMLQTIKAKSSRFIIITLFLYKYKLFWHKIKFGFLNAVAHVVLALLNFVLTNGQWQDWWRIVGVNRSSTMVSSIFYGHNKRTAEQEDVLWLPSCTWGEERILPRTSAPRGGGELQSRDSTATCKKSW